MKVIKDGVLEVTPQGMRITDWIVDFEGEPVEDLNTMHATLTRLLPAVLIRIGQRYGVKLAEADLAFEPTLDVQRITASVIAEAKWGGRPDLWERGEGD